MKKLTIIALLLLAFNVESFANNLIVGTPTVSGNTVSFTIKWDNSWLVTSGPSNWDAVWVFVKRQKCVSGAQSPWLHELLAASGHSITGSELQVDLAADKEGVFIRRSAAGIGNITEATVTLTLSSAIDSDNIGVYGTEMVNVPQGEFYIGDGSPTAGQWNFNFTDGSNSFNPKKITQAIQVAGIGAYSNYNRSNLGSTGDLGPNFPLGFNRFYCMKYEITTSQFTAFLNSLNFTQQLKLVRDMNTIPPDAVKGTLILYTTNGYRIEIKTPGNSTLDTPAVFGNDATNDDVLDQDNDALGFAVGLATKQFLSYLDWAGLRPMTEFEYEKACRGPIYPVVNEYSWGSTDMTPYTNYYIYNRFLPNEKLSGSGVGFSNVQTGMNYRGGIAATSASSREKAGATYYGILDMTGGMVEMCIGFRQTDYSLFTTQNGDGNINLNGFSDVSGWKEEIIGGRGGAWNYADRLAAYLSGRGFIQHWEPQRGTATDVNGNDNFGGRGVRSF